MQKDSQLRRAIQTACTHVVLAMSLLLIGGCATDTRAPSRSVSDKHTVSEGAAVKRFEDGRVGFAIKETMQLDEITREQFDRAVVLMKKKDFNPAIDLLKEVTEKCPMISAPHINIAIAYQYAGETEKAEAHFRTALQLVPQHPVASNEYALMLRQSGRLNEAREVYESTIARFPDYYPAHRNLGILCDLYLNDATCALNHYIIYSRARPDDSGVRLWIADLQNRIRVD